MERSGADTGFPAECSPYHPDAQPWPVAGCRIAVQVGRDDRHESELLFDPVHGTFQPLVHPEGRVVGFMTQRNDGLFWVVTKPGYRVEVYDGKEFRTLVDLTPSWTGDTIRWLLQTADARSGSEAAPRRRRRLRNGVLHMLGPADGFTETGGSSTADPVG